MGAVGGIQREHSRHPTDVRILVVAHRLALRKGIAMLDRTSGHLLRIRALTIIIFALAGCGPSNEEVLGGTTRAYSQTSAAQTTDDAAREVCSGYVNGQLDPKVHGAVSAAYQTDVQAALSLRDRLFARSAEEVGMVPPSLPTTNDLGLDPAESATLCYVDGAFQDPVPAGEPVPDRSIVLVVGERAIVLGGGLSKAHDGLTPLGTPQP
jgi:hypothetical protein